MRVRSHIAAGLLAVTPSFGAPPSAAPLDPTSTICALQIHEEERVLEDSRLAVGLANSSVAASGEIFRLIQGLWDADAIDRMSYLRAKYDYDAARLGVERAERILGRQQALVDVYRLACTSTAVADPHAVERAVLRYRRAECEQQAVAIEVASVNLEFNREFLASVRELRADEVATRPDVIHAELDVALEEQRLADAKRRTADCRKALGTEAPATSP